MKVTLSQIAKICGVSIGTVYRALNNKPEISRKTKEKIRRVARELDYRPHMIARSLVKGNSQTLGVVLLDLDNEFFAQLVSGIEARAKQAGYLVYLTLSNHDPAEEKRYLDHLVGFNVDGVILLPLNKGAEYNRYLQSLHTPIVTVGNRVSKKWPFVGINDRQAMHDSVRYLLSQGYQKIVYVSPPLSYKNSQNIYAVEERLAGYRQGIRKGGDRVKGEILKQKEFCALIEKILVEGDLKTAILCSSDIYALKTLAYLKERGIRVPQDVGLMGFDNIETLKHVDPRIATVDYPAADMGKRAVDLLIGQIQGEGTASEPLLLEHKRIPGESL